MKYKINYEIELTEQEFDLLNTLHPDCVAEYRDSEFINLESFISAKKGKSNQWFLDRNHNGTLHLMFKLFEKELVETEDMSWHLTYKITELGRKLIEQNR